MEQPWKKLNNRTMPEYVLNEEAVKEGNSGTHSYYRIQIRSWIFASITHLQ